jgi:hypothetical protein
MVPRNSLVYKNFNQLRIVWRGSPHEAGEKIHIQTNTFAVSGAEGGDAFTLRGRSLARALSEALDVIKVREWS